MSGDSRGAAGGWLPLVAPPGRRPYNQPIRDSEFVQRVRQYTPSSLVPLVARYGAAFNDKEQYRQPTATQYAPWVLAEVARVSLVSGTEFYRAAADDGDLWECSRAYLAITDRALQRREDGAIGRFLLRMSSQLVFQQPVLNDLARTVALFEQTTPKRVPKVATEGWPERLLDCSLQDYVGAAILLYTSALRNSGIFDLGWIEQSMFAEITRDIPAEVLRRVIEDHYVATVQDLKTMQQDADLLAGMPDAEYRRFSFNPLSSRPVVAGIADTLVIPVPGFLVRQASPLGIYYSGLNKWDTSFANDIGDLFESYVGRQLGLVPDAQVLPEIEFGSKKNKSLSVDWFLVFDSCVVLVEVKATRPTEPVRRADAQAGKDLEKRLGHSIDQLNGSACKIRECAPEFSSIPSGRPLLGLVVTMEPFHTVNSLFGLSYLPECDIPFRIASVGEIEQLVTVDDMSPGQLLLDFMTDTANNGSSINGALTGHLGRRNQIIDQAWATYPWND